MSKMKKIHENYTGTIARMDDEGNLEFDFCDDFGAHAILGEYDPAEARALADAIYKELGLGWLPYPENVPEEEDCEEEYLCVVEHWADGELIDIFLSVLNYECDSDFLLGFVHVYTS